MPRTRVQLLEYGCIVLAMAAAVLLAVGGQAAWLLRLGIVFALCAALLAAVLAVRARRVARAGRRAARPDGDETRDELEELRDELHALRQTLQALVGGELVVERVALQAHSTRLRSMPEQQFVDASTPRIAAQQVIPTQDARSAETEHVPESGAEAASADAVSETGRRRAAVGARSGDGQRSVDELLAANGAPSTPRHHRRRSA